MVFGNSRHVVDPYHGHICGLYYIVDYKRYYLPQVQLKSHTTVSPTSFTTRLTQIFHNSGPEKLDQARFTFPLYDSVCVNGYTITYGGKTLKGIVQQKDVAKKTFQAAVERGETAGLLESLPAGIFGVTIGNVPPGIDIIVDISYCGELKHDVSIDGFRYTLPTSIAPRYGSYPGQVLPSNTTTKGGIDITVDIAMGKSPIRKIQSPSHPIAVSMGGLSTSAATADFAPSQASATLSQGTAELAGDFILQVLVDDVSRPQLLLESHPTIPGQRAIMSTLVPKFTLPSAHPEIVFIADQSGSMSGTKNTALVAALKIFVKSLPFGVRFNICAFGSGFKFLWPESQAYNEGNVNMALAFVSGLSASMGGTEILQPIEAVFKQHLKGMPLEVMLLTDGEIWGEQQVFSYINKQIRDEQVDARIFALGIGEDVSHTLVEGVARAGNGFCQFVTQNEDTDQKVIRMLKGALYAHTKDYSLEVHYAGGQTESDEDDFEIVEKVKDCLIIQDNGSESATAQQAKPMSFFDSSADMDKTTETDPSNRYAHLPAVSIPKVIQAPAAIPPLFPFNRTTVYLLLGPESIQKEVKGVTLRATSAQGPLELTIPISQVSSGTSVHQLAARSAIQDLEEGRGWLQEAKTTSDQGGLIKEKHAGRFDEIVEQEIVRLGETFQVASKWTSFVAVEEQSGEQMNDDVAVEIQQESTSDLMSAPVQFRKASMARSQGTFSNTPHSSLFTMHRESPREATSRERPGSSRGGFGGFKPGGGLFGRHQAQENASSFFGAPASVTGGSSAQLQSPNSGGLFGAGTFTGGPGGNPFGQSQPANAFGQASFGTSQPSSSLFGRNRDAGSQVAGFGLFGNTGSSAASPFGMPSQTNSSSLFGAPSQASSAGIFGSSNQTTSGGLFGCTGSTPQQEGSLFGNTSTGGSSLFGNTGIRNDRINYGAQSAGPNTGSWGSGIPEASPRFAAVRDRSVINDADPTTGQFARLSRSSPKPSMSMNARTPSSFSRTMNAPMADKSVRESVLQSDEDMRFGTAAVMAFSAAEEKEESDEDMGFGFIDDDFEPRISLAAAPPPPPPTAAAKLGAMAAPIAARSSRAKLTRKKQSLASASAAFGAPQSATAGAPAQPAAAMHKIIEQQTFSGAWGWSNELLQTLGVAGNLDSARISDNSTVAATVIAIAYLEKHFGEKKDVWELVVEKAKAWLAQQLGGDQAQVNELVAKAKSQVP